MDRDLNANCNKFLFVSIMLLLYGAATQPVLSFAFSSSTSPINLSDLQIFRQGSSCRYIRCKYYSYILQNLFNNAQLVLKVIFIVRIKSYPSCVVKKRKVCSLENFFKLFFLEYWEKIFDFKHFIKKLILQNLN